MAKIEDLPPNWQVKGCLPGPGQVMEPGPDFNFDKIDIKRRNTNLAGDKKEAKNYKSDAVE